MAAAGGGGDLGAQVAELRVILEDTNVQWLLVRNELAGLRGQLAAAAPATSGPLLGAAPANGVEASHAEPHPTQNGYAGHWGPPTAPMQLQPKAKSSNRRSSAFATGSLTDVGQTCSTLGGKLITVETGSQLLGELEVVLIHPSGKQVAPEAFVSTGLVVCIQGMPSSPESMEEWCRAAVRAGWLNLGASVALPNLQMNSALQLEDLEAVLRGILERAGFQRCILVGKDWGGVVAVELASRSQMIQHIEGVVLIGPNTPVPPTAGEVVAPALLLWAQDDDISAYEDSELWAEALDGRCMPTTIKDCVTGAHQFDKIMMEDGVSEAVKSFTVSAFMLSELDAIQEGDEEEEDNDEAEGVAREQAEGSDSGSENHQDMPTHTAKNERLSRLQAELPAFLQAESPPFPVEELGSNRLSHVQRGRQSAVKRLSMVLPQWLQAGMTHDSE